MRVLQWLCLLVASTLLEEASGNSVPVLPALGTHFADVDLQKGWIAGSVTIRGPRSVANTPPIDFYSVYWGSDAATKLTSHALANLSVGGSGTPSCSGASCAEIMIYADNTSSTTFFISRGQNGYNDHESATISLHSAGTVTVTYLHTESGYDFLRIGSVELSGSGSGNVVPVEPGTTISWTSDFSVTRSGWSVTYQSDMDAMVTTTLSSMAVPQGASHFLVYSGNSFGEMTAPFSTAIRDMYVLPAPSSLSFLDYSMAANHVSGTLQLVGPSDVSNVQRYDVYWGDHDRRLGVCSGAAGYRFEPGPSLTTDCSRNAWNLATIAAETVPGPLELGGYGLRFDGSFAAEAVANVTLCDPSQGWTACQFSADWTVAAWINPSVTPMLPVSLVVKKEYASSETEDEVGFYLTSGAVVRCKTEIVGHGPFSCEASSSSLPRNAWSHVVCTRETVGSTTQMRIYVNGQSVQSCASTEISLAQTRFPSKLMIGGNAAAIAAGMESYFDGVLDEVALFNFSFTAADVHLLYNGYRVATWPVGGSTSITWDTAVPRGATTLHAVSVGEFVESSPLVVVLMDWATPVNLPVAVNFTDTDPGIGSYGGIVVVTRPSNESDLSGYMAFWGSNSTTPVDGSQLLGGVDVIGTNGTTAIINLMPGLVPPAGASHIVVVSVINNPPTLGASLTGVGTVYADYAPPSVMAQAVSFTDTNPVLGRVSGDIMVTRASDETGVVSYNLYFASVTMPLQLIVKLPVGSATLSYSLSDVAVPFNASRILVVLEGSGGEATIGVSTTSLESVDGPSNISFQDLNPAAGAIEGTIRIGRAAAEANVQAYEIHWATGDGAAAPTEIQLLESIPISQLSTTNLIMVMYDSYGDGWNNAYYYIHYSDGTELASGTMQTGSFAEHTISLSNVPSGETLLLTVTRGGWPGEISWHLKKQNGETILHSDTETFPLNMPFSASGGGGGGVMERNVSASIPSSANHFLTFSRLTDGSNSLAVWTPIVDFVPPSNAPTSIDFSDTNGSVGIIAGTITIGRATDETGITDYKIYWGTGPSTKLPSYPPLSISVSTSPLVANMPATVYFPNVTYLLAFSSSASGENMQPAYVAITDLQQPTSAPTSVMFTDEDPRAGWYGGMVSFLPAQHLSAITYYQCYWGSSASTPDFGLGSLGNVSVSSPELSIYINSTQAPSGMTHLVVVSANGAYSMPTGSGVLLVDYSTVTVVPSSVEFQDTDASLANIAGAVTIGAASDESAVVDYAVYWGATSTAKLPGGVRGWYAEFFVLDSCPCSTCFVDFSTLNVSFLQRSENVSLYSSGRPGGSLTMWPGLNRSELFAARWSGWIHIITPGFYLFHVSADDQAKLFVDGVEVTMGLDLTSGFHSVELQYFQCFGTSYVSATIRGVDTDHVATSLWDIVRSGDQEQSPISTAAKTGSTVVATISATAIPSGATHLLVFARAAGGVDSVSSVGTEVVNFVKPSVAARYMNFTDTDPSPGMVGGILTIGRAQNEANLNFYKIYWGSSATEILNSTSTRRLQTGTAPSCSGATCGEISISAGETSSEWVVSRGSYSNHEQASITLTGPGEVRFTFIQTETCCDKLIFFHDTPPVIISGYSLDRLPEVISLADGVHSVEWSSDYSVTTSGWSFTYKYLGTTSSTPGLLAVIPKPSGSQDLAYLIENQQPPGSHFIVKTAYDSTESDAILAIPIGDLSPPEVSVGQVTFTDTNNAVGMIGGSVTIAAYSSDITGFNIYWARDSSNLISQGNPGLLGEYFYLSSTPSSMPDLSAAPDVVQVETQLNQPETTSPWPGLTVTANFAARWTGYINITAAGNYFFTLSSDAGSQLFINDAMVVDNDGRHAFQSVTSQGVYLLPGLRSLQVLFFNDDGSYGIVLEYQGPDTSNLRIVVPPNVLRHGSLNNAFIGQIDAAASGDTIFQVQNLAVPREASHILVKGYNAQGEGANGSSTEIADAFSPTEMATALYFTDMDPTPGQIAGTVVLQGATNQSSISHYVIYWGSSATAKADSNPIGQISASGSGSSSGLSCGVKGPDSTPLRFTRNGVNGPKIVNGQDASECEWRWQASLRTTNGFSFCGGALISPKWVMSAAHCMDGTTNFVVVLGDFNKDSSHDQHERSYSVQRVISHEDYNSQSYTHDFALIELAEEVDMGECVATACLPEAEATVGQECFITGWGTLSSGGSAPSTLQEGRVLTLSNSECNARYGSITADMLCAQGSSSAGIVDACQGDSGGPMVCPGQDGRYILHGATSWGYGCADAQYPGVWARISHVLPWVTNHTGIQPGTASGNLTYNISSQSIPSSVTHLLVYTAMNGLEMTTGISIPLIDFAPVQAVPASISFTDTDASPGELGGTITLGRASDESEVIGYAVFWGTESVVMDLAVQGLKGSGDTVELQLPANTPKPAGATHLLGFVTSGSGRGATYVSVNVTDFDSSLVSGGLTFHDTDAGAMQIGGTVTVQRAAATTGISAYNLYFSTGNCDVVGSQIVSLQVSDGGGGPLCTQGAACSSITIFEESGGKYVISRGMSGYENNEHAIIQLQGPGVIEFNRFETERNYDTLRVDEATYSGFDLPANLELGTGMKEIEWYSDFSVTRQGWVLSYQSYSTFGDIIYELPNGTAIPSGANSLIVLSQTSAGENTAACASTTLVDFAPPSSTAQGLWFEDVNPSAGRVAGTLTILQARSQGSLSEYRIYWGMNSTTVLQGSNMLFTVTASTPGTNLTIMINDTMLPSNASHLLAFAASSQGESPTAASTEVIDYAPAQESAQGVTFTDMDPTAGFVRGTANISRAVDESTIENYNLYFSSGQSKISFIGSVQAASSTARPSCNGPTCSQISITEVAAMYQVNRGTSYSNNEHASIIVSGPGSVRFIFFNTEQNYDFITILGTGYSGNTAPNAPPETISIPAGTHEITWRSDGSVTAGGWKFMYESLVSDDVAIEVPQSAIPAGATDLLVVSNASGGEMSSGVTTPLVDYNPPTVVAESIQCEDNDTSIGLIHGNCTITRATDETGVSAYEIFWGNATHPLSTSLGRLALADVTGSSRSEIVIPFVQFVAHPSATHLLAVAVGPGGAAPTGVSTVVVDNIGLTLSTVSVDVLGVQNSTTNETITVTSRSSAPVTLNIQLLMEDGSARSTSAEGISGTVSSSSSTNLQSANVPTICLEGASHVQKSRLIFKMKKGSGHGRRLQAHARKLESRHGARVKTFERLGGLAFAEIKDASLESYCRLFTELDHDPDIDFVEEDQTWHALGHTIQVEQPEYDLFPPGGKAQFSERRTGHMHRRAPQCHLGDCEGGKATHPNDGSYEELWGLHQDNDIDIDAPEAWDIHKGLSGQVIVAVIDTGVDYNHQDLQNQMWRNPGEIPGDGIDNDGNGFVDDVYGYDFYEEDGDPMDSNGHGTHCAGTIGAEGGNSIGVVGVIWKPQIMALRFLGPNGGSTTGAIRAVDYAVQMGAHLTSNSWGGGGYSNALVAAIEAAGEANQLFVVAAGNDGRDNEISATYPCNYNLPNMICVASTDSSNDISSFSNWGINVVHIAAPGSRIHSTYPNNGYQALSGTSMATPHVAGVAALVLDYAGTNLPFDQLRDLILNSAVRFSKFSAKVSTGALLNAHAALVMASQFAWIRMSGSAISDGSITIPAESSALINLEMGGTGLTQGEYRARLRLWGTFNGVLYSQIIPILFTLHSFAGGAVYTAAALQFQDLDERRGMISGALTVERATAEQEATFSQYHIFWAGASQSKLTDLALAALDTGNVLQDNFANFDSTFWSGPNGEDGSTDQGNWSVSNGAAVFSNHYPYAHLTLARRFAPPFTVKTKVRKASGAFAHMVVQIGGSSVGLFDAGGIRAVFFGSQKVLITPDGHHETVPCVLSTWFEVTIEVKQNQVTFADNQGCDNIVKSFATFQETKNIRIGADCTGQCAESGGSVFDYFEASGGLYATFNVPEGTVIPTGATGFVAHGWNVLGLSPMGLYQSFTDFRVANRATQPSDVQGSAPSTSSLTVSWARGSLNDCAGFFIRYEVLIQSASSASWSETTGCQGLVSQTSESCVATGLTSDTPYQFKVRVLCSLEETQSLWSEISAAAVTLPLPAVAPTQLRARLPGSSTLMVSWQSGFLNDCEFVESVVQGQIVGQTTWFRPAGCQNLTLLNSYHCTAEGLTPDTQYIFRVQTNCSDPQSSSPWSVSSLPESTLATVQEWESNQRRLLAINIVSDVDYNQVVSNVEAFKSSIASQTALSLGVDASKVKVEIMAGEATSASRRLAALSTVFTVTVEGATQDESHTSNEVVAGVASTVQQKTGSTSTLSVASTSSLTPAIAPQKITWSETGDGRLKLHWNPLPLGDCSFLAWHVLANAGGSNTPVAGCTSLTNLSHTDCSAVGLDGSKSNTFTVAVLCANPAANSAFSLASDAWQTVSTTSTQNPMLTLLTTGEPTTPSTSQTTTPCTIPPVELTSPWTASQRISQQAKSLTSPMVAQVGNAGCQVPNTAMFAWVVASEVDERITAKIHTQVSFPSPGVASVWTSAFDSSLTPSTSYIYALLRAENSQSLTAGTNAQSLAEAAELGITITRSPAFVVDAAPSAGHIQMSPVQGEALKTSFTFSTNGWSDEDNTSLHFAYFVFPLSDSYSVSVGADGHLQSTPAFQPPQVDFNDATSARFWSKIGGLLLRSFAAAPSVSGSRLSSKAFYTVVRARDAVGGVSHTTALGPLVQTPTDLSQEDLTNALAESKNSGDASQILASVQVVMSLSGDTGSDGSGVTTAALDALTSVSQMDNVDDETLQQLGSSVTQVVDSGNMNSASLTQAIDILQSCLDSALSSTGLSVAVGASVLEAAASVGQASTSLAASEVKSVSTKMVSLISNLGAATLASLQRGETQEMDSVDANGSGIKMAVSKPSVSEAATSGLQLKQLIMTPEVFSGRRLDSCNDLEVQVTEWKKSNPYSYTQKVLEKNGTVSFTADVLSVKINYCKRTELTQPTSVSFPIPDFGAASANAMPACARFDEQLDSWTTHDVTTAIDANTGTVSCSSTRVAVSYTVFADTNESVAVTTTVISSNSKIAAAGLSVAFWLVHFL